MKIDEQTEREVASLLRENEALRARVEELERGHRAIVAVLDGRQPKDAPGALMVAQSMLKGAVKS